MDTGTGGDTATAGSGGATGSGGASGSGAGGTTGAAGSGGGAGATGAAGRGGTTGAAGRGGTTGTGGAAGRGGQGGTAGGATGGSGTSTAPSCTWPTPASTVMLSATQTITGVYEGGMRRFVGSGPLGTSGQNEDQPALLNVANGATLQNVIIGNPGADGIHCEGTCTLKNVWWEDVGEDAATLQGSTPGQVMTIDGGGARGAADKVFQHNGPGTMIIQNFCVQDFGKLYRSCGNCMMQYQRNVQVRNIIAIPGNNTSSLVGVNSNYNDTATLSAITIRARTTLFTICQRYTGNSTGAEPMSSGSGPDGTVCKYTTADITWMP